jgi:hypothetical protein
MISTTRPVAQHLDQPGGERGGERRLADDAVQDADRRDADLHGRQPLRRVLVQRERSLRAGLAGLVHHLQPRLARGGERHLGHGEEAVEQDQYNQ